MQYSNPGFGRGFFMRDKKNRFKKTGKKKTMGNLFFMNKNFHE